MAQPDIVKNLSYRDRINYLRLIRTENIGPKTFMNLMSLYSNIDEVILKIPELSIRGGRKKPLKVISISDAEKEYDEVTKLGAELIIYYEEAYPPLLREISDPPPILTILGNKELLTRDHIAIVGARNSSSNAYNFTINLAKELSAENYLVTSGLARGIDTAAHSGCINYCTAAVIAGGIDNIYPPENHELYNKIRESGVIIAEAPFGTIPRAQNFPQRNRIISGLSLGVAVIEAGLSSGSLITARYALEQNREIFALPGFPLDPRCKGSNKLIKDGAILIESSKDILEYLKFLENQKIKSFQDKNKSLFQFSSNIVIDESELSNARKIIISKLNSSPSNINVIIETTGFSIQVVLTILIELELAEKIERHSDNQVSLKFI